MIYYDYFSYYFHILLKQQYVMDTECVLNIWAISFFSESFSFISKAIFPFLFSTALSIQEEKPNYVPIVVRLFLELQLQETTHAFFKEICIIYPIDGWKSSIGRYHKLSMAHWHMGMCKRRKNNSINRNIIGYFNDWNLVCKTKYKIQIPCFIVVIVSIQSTTSLKIILIF